MNILFLNIINHGAAIIIDISQRRAVFQKQICHNLFSKYAQIAGHDQIVVRRFEVQILQVGPDGLIGRRRHGSAHVVCILNSIVCNDTGRSRLDIRPLALRLNQDAACPCHGPLCRWGPLTAVDQRRTILPLCRGEVGRGHGRCTTGIAAIHHHSC